MLKKYDVIFELKGPGGVTTLTETAVDSKVLALAAISVLYRLAQCFACSVVGEKWVIFAMLVVSWEVKLSS